MTKPITFHENYSLIQNTTFGVDANCYRFAEPNSVDKLILAIKKARENNWKICIIGEGSNLLFLENFEGMVIRPAMKGVEIISESEDNCIVRAGAGENWDDFVAWCVERNLFGTENLSHIPGAVGATPVQNIGAYGREAKDIIEEVEVFDTEEMQSKIFNNASCNFAYRDSIFKHSSSGKYIVCHVTFRLKKNANLVLDYGNVKEEFLKEEVQDLATLRKTIIKIRSSKLPDPAEIGNAGSFFKNPVITKEHFSSLKKQFNDIPNYSTANEKVKIPAAWLIQHAGWKGVREGQTGTWPTQPLVIVNYGSASGKEIFEFSEKIRLDIKSKFNISLRREVLTIP